MDEKHNAQSDTPRKDESAQQGGDSAGISEETAGSPRAGTTPTGQSPQGTGRGEPGGGTYQPGQGGKGGGGYQPGQSERAGGITSPPGQAGEGKGGPGDRTNLSGMGGPEKSTWNQDPEPPGIDGES